MDGLTNDLNDQNVVLVIDDSVEVHRLLDVRLSREDIQIVSATSGPEGLKIAIDSNPNVVLLDLDMPEMDGFEVLRLLKEEPQTRNTPVIVLSGLQSTQDKVTAFNLGAIDYVTKPFDLTELRVRVRSALRQSNLMRMLEQRAQIDGLTGLYNRTHFDARWKEECSRARRNQTQISLAVMDCDHFKSINDTYGHPAGDSVLQGFAKIMQRECRATDIPCRFGGEEFVVIMSETGPEQGHILCDRIRRTMADVTWSRHPERQVTISIGLVGGLLSDASEPGAILEVADRQLYAAKTGGRNRVCVSGISGEMLPNLKLAG